MSAPIAKKILLVDDDPGVRGIAELALQMAGFAVLVADSGEIGLQVFRERRGEIQLVISDVLMPGVDGLTMVERIRELNPEVPVLFISGTGPEGPCPHRVLQKPFTPATLLQSVRRALNPEVSGRSVSRHDHSNSTVNGQMHEGTEI